MRWLLFGGWGCSTNRLRCLLAARRLSDAVAAVCGVGPLDERAAAPRQRLAGQVFERASIHAGLLRPDCSSDRSLAVAGTRRENPLNR